jgi:hypothetical protein
VSVTKLPANAQAVVAKWLGHWYDWTSSQIEQYVPDITFKNFEPTTIQEIVRKNVGYQWWANIDEYKAKAQVEGADSFTTKRIRRRNTFSYLGWLDQPNLTGQGYNAYLSYADLQQMESPALFVQFDKSLVITGADNKTELSPDLLKIIAKETEEANKLLKAAEEAAKVELPKTENGNQDTKASTDQTASTPGTVRAGAERPTELAALSRWIVLHENKEVDPPVGDRDYDVSQAIMKATNTVYTSLPKQFLTEAARLNLNRSDVKDSVVKNARIKTALKLLTTDGINPATLRKSFYLNTGKAINEYGFGSDGVDVTNPSLKKYLDFNEQTGDEYIKDGESFAAEQPRSISTDVLRDKIIGWLMICVKVFNL